MARCKVCGKGTHFGNSVSHTNRKTRSEWKANFKSVRVKINGAAKKINVCTSCLKSNVVERA